MAELTPHPFRALAARMLRELDRQQAIFDLPAKRFEAGSATCDFSVDCHGRRLASPLGPAAGPHTQMAQNLVLGWLAGARVFELKTVQVRDDLTIPRPCIDMRTVGFNAEWSQELRLEQSLEEYVKGSMLIALLEASGRVPLAPGFGGAAFDVSLGYDLAGVQSERVRAFVAGLADAGPTIDRLRGEIPGELSEFRDLDFPRQLADTVTLSTFHGCPPEEIERLAEFVLRELGMSCVVKLNPTLLGEADARRLLHEALGYHDLRLLPESFARDLDWERAVALVGRLRETARELGLGFGIKLTNTLIVANDTGFLPASEREVYLSGPPLHVLAVELVRRFRRTFGGELPISFSAGIDAQNFPDAVALGLVPVTVCTDLLKKGGYGRLAAYHPRLAARFAEVGARDVDGFVLRASGAGLDALADCGVAPGSPEHERCVAALAPGADARAVAGPVLFARWVAAARVRNAEAYAARVAADPRYARARHAVAPPKIGRHLALFDCVSCDICVPVCPNDANFTWGAGPTELPVLRLVRQGDGWLAVPSDPLRLVERHQIGNFADFCNDCGNCDVFCPEDGGPYKVKPRFFGSEASFRADAPRDGFCFARQGERAHVRGRFDGRELALTIDEGSVEFSGPGFRVVFAIVDAAASARAEAAPEVAEIDLTYAFLMDHLRRAVLEGPRVNYLENLLETAP